MYISFDLVYVSEMLVPAGRKWISLLRKLQNPLMVRVLCVGRFKPLEVICGRVEGLAAEFNCFAASH